MERTVLDWDFLASTVAPLVQAGTSTAAVLGLLLVWYQIKVTNAWNRANSQHNLLSNLPSQELEIEVWTIVASLQREAGGSIDEESSRRIYETVAHWVAVKTFLNKYEQLCAAVNANALDERYAYDVHGAKIVDAFRTFERYIEFTRQRSDDDTIYLELEVVATRWRELTEDEQATVRQKIGELQRTRATRRHVQ